MHPPAEDSDYENARALIRHQLETVKEELADFGWPFKEHFLIYKLNIKGYEPLFFIRKFMEYLDE